MTIGEHVDTFAGLKVVDWDTSIEDPANTAYRISADWDGDTLWSDRLAIFVDDPHASEVCALVVGAWDNSESDDNAEAIVEALCAARQRLPNLKAIFFGDITYSENEISWIQQTDVSLLFEAYPQLTEFRVRGGNGLRIGHLDSEALTSLIVETGGLDVSVLQDILASHLPNLEHLEIWLGSDGYGATITLEDLAPLLSGQFFPKLRYLGLRDSEFADRIAIALTQSPLLERIRVLDLSLGTLGDEGAQALLDCPIIPKLEKLDLHHHYCSDEIQAKLQSLPCEVDLSDLQQEDTYDNEVTRYVAVSE